MMLPKWLLKSVLLLMLFTWLQPVGHVAAAGQPVAVLLATEQGAFLKAADSLEGVLKAQGGVDVQRFTLTKDPAKHAAVIDQVSKLNADLVVALGSQAVDKATGAIKGTPIMAGMVMDLSPWQGQVTGVILDIPFEVQLEWLQQFLPEAKRIGVLYNPKENEAKVEQLKTAASAKGLTLEGRTVSSPKELVSALDSLANNVDVLLGVADKVVLTSKTAQKILLFSFRNRIPFVGLSEAWVKAGALYALDRDYADIGTQCGEVALRLIKGDQVAPAAPRKIVYSVNMKAAEQMKVQLAKPLVDGAIKLY